MDFIEHYKLQGTHAYLSASNYHWLNYSDEKFLEVLRNSQAARVGSELHDLAARAIKHRIKLQRSRKTLNAFVNDAIGYRMTPEQILYYSDRCYGTADAIGFEEGILRIFDLKTGVIKASLRQLHVYAALFCLEYGEKPERLEFDLRIYQNDMVVVDDNPGLVETIKDTMALIKHFDQLLVENGGL